MEEEQKSEGKSEVGYKKPPVHTRFKKGVPTGTKGRPKKIPELDTLLAEVLGHDDKSGGRTHAEIILRALRAKASKGDIRAAEVLLNRAYGTPRQSIDHTTDGQKINIPVITWVQNNEQPD